MLVFESPEQDNQNRDANERYHGLGVFSCQS